VNRHVRLIAFAVLLLVGAPACAHAQSNAAAQPSFNQLLEDWRHTLDAAQAALGDSSVDRAGLDNWRSKAGVVRQAAEQARAEADAQRKPAKDQLAALGPAPQKGQPPEPVEVARSRKQLTDDFSRFDARVKQAELTIARAAGLEADLARVANERMAQLLLTRGRPPLSLPALAAATRELGQVLSALADAPIDWWVSSPFSQLTSVSWAWLGLVVLGAVGAGWPLRNWLLRRYGHLPEMTEPTYARRVLAAGAEALARGLLPAAGLLALVAVLLDEEIVSGLLSRMVSGVLAGITFFSLASAFARAALAPEAPNWRIVPLGADASRTLARRLTALAATAALEIGIGIATRDLRPGAPELFSLVWLVFNSIAAGLMLSLLGRKLWHIEQEQPAPAAPGEAPAPTPWLWPGLRMALGAALVTVPFLALSGYGNLAGHIVSRVVGTGLIVGVLLLLRTLLREAIAHVLDPESADSTRLRRALSLTDQGSRIFIFWVEAALDVLLVLLGTGLALRLWGGPGVTIGPWVEGVLRGIEIGNLKLSLVDIVLAILVFIGVWTATRLVQRLLREKLLPQTRLDVGVRHSLTAFVGYIGFVVAAIFATLMLGLNLSNLAIIAGALSVGIGFGLQNMVNNFVSGLVLLLERPIKVGDWVVVGQHQGYVKRISVRATEIETFERASVIVPNAELLSSAVVNWTHRDRYGRVDIKVGVAYGSDTEKVRDILLACARENRYVMSWPEPHVLFRAFGDNALQFELRGYVSDVERGLFISSDLHYAIDKSFRGAGIEMPFPQRELVLRNVDALARALGGAAAAGPRDGGEQDGNGAAQASP
jgi:small-conductance mechanosensitive channel